MVPENRVGDAIFSSIAEKMVTQKNTDDNYRFYQCYQKGSSISHFECERVDRNDYNKKPNSTLFFVPKGIPEQVDKLYLFNKLLPSVSIKND